MGELFIGQLAWTGGYSFDFDLDPEMSKFPGLDAAAALTFSAGPRRSSSAASDRSRRDRDHP